MPAPTNVILSEAKDLNLNVTSTLQRAPSHSSLPFSFQLLTLNSSRLSSVPSASSVVNLLNSFNFQLLTFFPLCPLCPLW